MEYLLEDIENVVASWKTESESSLQQIHAWDEQLEELRCVHIALLETMLNTALPLKQRRACVERCARASRLKIKLGTCLKFGHSIAVAVDKSQTRRRMDELSRLKAGRASQLVHVARLVHQIVEENRLKIRKRLEQMDTHLPTEIEQKFVNKMYKVQVKVEEPDAEEVSEPELNSPVEVSSPEEPTQKEDLESGTLKRSRRSKRLSKTGGIGIIILGSVLQLNSTGVWDILGDERLATPILLLVFGCLCTLVGFLGCCGAIRENYCLTVSFAVLLALIIVGWNSKIRKFCKLDDRIRNCNHDIRSSRRHERRSDLAITKWSDAL
ncbi:hypothetical protein WR25_21243 isoform B [Diploscapter pachys]|uniref:Uncharacterized protein n=1 Tax=Diploscapter pachys TaxID=2018661 RepID=A0A2A2JCZ3_9BILA|nr:hypothetical protein WR25_21243 isoform A [Diploscapter pachys]PAV59648.1 hypothetical protein WR25_21243 isoform B [Diploscapter pachys]